MAVITTPLGGSSLPDEVINEDKRACRKFGPCGVGDEAIYLNSRFVERKYYAEWSKVKRVYKRIAISEGAFTGKGIFGAMPFLVVVFADGTEREFPFKQEPDVDRMLMAIADEHPKIPTYSKEAKARLDAAAAEEKKRYSKNISGKAKATIKELDSDIDYLENNQSLYTELASAAKQKRVADNFPITAKIIGTVLAVGGIFALALGVMRLITHAAYPYYFITGGAIAFFAAHSSNIIPSKWNSKKYAQEEWEEAVENMAEYLKGKPKFAIPPQFAHPVSIERTIRVIREGRAETAEEAFALMKEDLRALNSTVAVTQKEHDEVVAIKSLFLACDYKDEL